MILFIHYLLTKKVLEFNLHYNKIWAKSKLSEPIPIGQLTMFWLNALFHGTRCALVHTYTHHSYTSHITSHPSLIQFIGQFLLCLVWTFWPFNWGTCGPASWNLIMIDNNLSIGCDLSYSTSTYSMETRRLYFHCHSTDIISHYGQFTPKPMSFQKNKIMDNKTEKSFY